MATSRLSSDKFRPRYENQIPHRRSPETGDRIRDDTCGRPKQAQALAEKRRRQAAALHSGLLLGFGLRGQIAGANENRPIAFGVA